MGDGYARVGRRRNCRGDTGHHFKGYAVFHQGQGFFAAATEYKGIATLEPHHDLAGLPSLHQQNVDLVLGQRLSAPLLSHKNSFRR